MFIIAPTASGPQRLPVLLAAQAGKAGSYVMAGLALGSIGSVFAGYFDRHIGFLIAQWASAAMLCWIGLSVAGMVPSLAAFDRLARPLGAVVARLQSRRLAQVYADAALGGFLWGMIPCGMVFAALLSALLAGSPLNGAMLMLGFAMGTVPAVTGAAVGIGALRAHNWGDRTRVLAGLAIAAIGLVGLLLTAPGGPLCLSL